MAQAMAEVTLKPIGYFNGAITHKSAIPRQGVLSQQQGFIEFEKGFDSKLGLQGLNEMSHVWIIFLFHKATSPAKPLVRPPRKPEIQVGVWATRSPYRPNSIGLTLAKIEKVVGKKLFISQIDLLGGTPILDIKPYVTQSDRPKKPKLGWIDRIETWKFKLSSKALKQTLWLKENGLNEIDDVLESQFGTPPLQFKRKRVKPIGKHFELSYRTWRFVFKVNLKSKVSQILEVKSGYSETELHNGLDAYSDKNLHREFNNLN